MGDIGFPLLCSQACPKTRSVMSSKRKNASGSTSCTQSAERVAAHDVELKVSDISAPVEFSEPVEFAAPETEPSAAPERPLAVEASPAHEASSAEAPPTAETAPTSEAPPGPEPAHAPRNLSLHASAIPLSIKPDMSIDWPLTRKRQVFNFFYFGVITLQLLGIGHSGIIDSRLLLQFLYICAAVTSFLTFASLIYLGDHRRHQTSTDELSPRVRRSLRAVALLVPAVALVGFMRYEATDTEAFVPPTAPTAFSSAVVPTAFSSPAFDAEMSAGKRAYRHGQYGDARAHFEKAAVLNPQSDSAFEWVANSNDSLRDSTAAITAGLRAIYLNPENENAHVILSHAYNMAGNYTLGLEYSQRAAALNPEDGEAYGNMSNSFNGLGQPDKALLADNSHVKYHGHESIAFDQRARTLERLGRVSEAKFDRQMADNIRWGRTTPPH